MGRVVSAGSLVRDQVDFFLPGGGMNRVTGIVVQNLSMSVFALNDLLSWTLVDGTDVSDSSISAGSIFFNEISGAPGFYSIRFFPDRTGYWRVVMRNTSLSSESSREYDIGSGSGSSSSPSNGLNASFLPPGSV